MKFLARVLLWLATIWSAAWFGGQLFNALMVAAASSAVASVLGWFAAPSLFSLINKGETTTSLGIPYNIAVVDAGGALVAFTRQDGALVGSIDLAIGKAKTARMFDKTTEYLAQLAQPRAAAART